VALVSIAEYLAQIGAPNVLQFPEGNVRHELEALTAELKDLESQLAAIKSTIYGLALIYGPQIASPEVLKTARPEVRKHKRGLSEACHSVLQCASGPCSVSEVCAAVNEELLASDLPQLAYRVHLGVQQDSRQKRHYRGCHVARVEVLHLRLGDFLDLLARHLADFVLVRNAGALLDAGGFEQEHGRGRGLGDERERAVGEDGDDDRDDEALVLRRARVERLAELHDVHAVLAERGADGRSGRCLSRGNLELDVTGDLFSHLRILIASERLSALPSRRIW